MSSTNWRPGGNSFTSDDWSGVIKFMQDAREEFERNEVECNSQTSEADERVGLSDL